MHIRMFGRAGAVLGLAIALAACSSNDSGTSDRGSATSAAGVSSECRWNRSKCLYEGQYEPGERDYAEQEAKRLNKIASERLRRSARR